MSSEIRLSTTGGQSCQEMHCPIADLNTSAREDFRQTDAGTLLVASRSHSSGEMVFPQRAFCPVTGARDMEPITFGPNGILYSFSTIHVSSSRPTPYTLGYVDFDNGLRVMCHVRCDDVSRLHCDMPVQTDSDAEGWFVKPIQKGGVQ
ncbi:Zn-ribbon domain-containing OB-fold protein [Celeribacter sp.]|uniref:Zn-ribbon domain-containing OB-fold protein n=1 Tax=Celeribacter sp. TaxID=1890673 RepID=UPI003A90AC66